MKLSLLFLGSCAALATPALAQDTVPASTPKFDWKLRLTKGQTWTQTLATRIHMVQQMPAMVPGGKPVKFEMDLTQSTGFKNEVTQATPAYYLVRVTYTGLNTESKVKIDGKTPPGPAPDAPKLDYAGLSFTLKQAPDGRVLDVTDLDDFIARQKKMMDSLGTTPGMGAFLGSMTPSADSFKAMMKHTRSMSVPPRPLAVGESYPYAIDLPLMGALKFAINGKRTLLSFDAEKAVFDESGTFSVPPTQMFGPTAKPAKQVTPVIFDTTAAPVFQLPKMFMTMKGTQSGKSTLDAVTGLTLKSNVSQIMTGKMTIVDQQGGKKYVPLTATSISTTSTSVPTVR